MISILVPTRKRPDNFWRTAASARETSREQNEVVFYVDDDDDSYRYWPPVLDYLPGQILTMGRGPRITLSDMWNKCAEKASGEILMMCADDAVFRDKGWDVLVEQAFAASEDKILLCYPNDGVNKEGGCVFPIVHRKWVETLGYFCPPHFVGDYPDTWMFEIAKAVGRVKYLPFLVEHCHWLFKKAPLDQTYKERAENEKKQPPAELYAKLLPQRLADIEKLRAVMHV